VHIQTQVTIIEYILILDITMSDARNSSNSLRGGGAKQTGGSGRTNKYAQGTNRTNTLQGLNGQVHAERSEAKQKLQLLVSSKQLASDVRTLLLEEHTEQEYTSADIPLPSTEDAKKKLKSMKEFTDKWYDKQFREEWLQTVTNVWIAEIKAQYDAAVAAAEAEAAAKRQQPKEEGQPQSIEELEELIANLDDSVPAEERQRLKKKLKKKKQQKAKKENTQ
jgi:hypothetical protein